MIYRKTGDDIELESAAFSEGRFVRSAGGIIRPMIHITDHLGSVRAVVDGLTGQTVETNDYYPFGSRWEDEDGISDPTNRYRFNGKEDQEGEFGVPTLDYGARHYTTSSARWLSMDPLSEKYYGVSPYAFCNNDPVNFVDLDGRFVWAIPVVKLFAYGAGAAATMYAAQKLTKYESSKYNPGWDYQRQNDRKGKEALDKAQLNVQNSFKENFPDPDNFDPNDGPKFRRGGNGAKIALGLLYLLGENHKSIRKYLSRKLGLENNSNEPEVDEQQAVYIEDTDKDEEINEMSLTVINAYNYSSIDEYTANNTVSDLRNEIIGNIVLNHIMGE